MCWAYKAASGADIQLADRSAIDARAGAIVASGRDGAMIHYQGNRLTARTMRYGMSLVSPMGRKQLFWNARDDKLEDSALWGRLIRQRCVVPVSAYCETMPEETWFAGAEAWMIGLYDEGNGMALVTEADPARPGVENARRPILLDAAGAKAWLDAADWDAPTVFRKLPRVSHPALDLFEGVRLSTEARNPLNKKAA